ncbi:MAG: substrate-binding domain-containing protein [bacterium]|nr:substrate-binding domain-containing protein [bacterium]
MIKEEQKKIALFMELNDSYDRAIARGVLRYAHTHESWRLYGFGWMFLSFEDLETEDGDGIIARVETEEDAARLSALKLPVVDVAGGYLDRGFHQVNNDDYQTGVKAGEYLLSCGYRRLAYCGVPDVGWSVKREAGFLSSIEHVCQDAPRFLQPRSWWKSHDEFDGLKSWLRSLRFPVGIFACNDIIGLKLAKVCATCGIKVPDEVAILGVDNDDLLCELASPTLSSIPLACERVGYRAAEALDGIMKQSSSRETNPVVLYQTSGDTVERESTQMFVCADPLVSKAVQFIRVHATDGIHVTDLVSNLGVSRRNLEVRFKREIGMTIHEEIIRFRLMRAKTLLKASDCRITDVVKESGFGTLQSFYSVFKDYEGCTPAYYRKQNRQI